MRREEEVSCPSLDLHLDLQVSPVDGEQCAVRAGGAQLPGAVGHVPVAVSQEDQRREGGNLAGEGASAEEGRGLHFICTPTHTSLILHIYSLDHRHPTPTPPTPPILMYNSNTYTYVHVCKHTHVQYPPQTCELTRPTPHKTELTLSGKSTYLWLPLEGKMLTPKVSRDCRGRKDRRQTRSGHQL